jgi:DNA-directed RNA polymerase specialized sigma24 family protein
VPPNSEAPSTSSHARFAETRWTVVLSARAKEAPESGAALETLCRMYWAPLYAFARRHGFGEHDAQDHTQAFFARMLEKDFLRLVAPEKGRFRTFLLVAFKRFLANVREHACAQRRGGGQVLLSIDVEAAENLYLAVPRDDASAEVIYERRWALTLLDHTLARLRQEYTAAGKTAQFEQLKEFLTTPKPAGGYGAIAGRLGLSPGAARVAVHRLRQRYREIFRDEIAQTVGDPAEIDDEVSYLLTRLGG